MTVSDNTIAAEKLIDFFRSLGKKTLNASKKVAKKVEKNRKDVRQLGQRLALQLRIESPKEFYQPY